MAFLLKADIGHVVGKVATSNGVIFRDWLAAFLSTGSVDDEIEICTPPVAGSLPFPCAVN